MLCDRIWRNARLATLSPDLPGLGIVEDGLIACSDGVIQFAGSAADAPAALEADADTDIGGRWITPGLIDCHTHLVYGGDRAHEFEIRLAGASYEEVARAGGRLAGRSGRGGEDRLRGALDHARPDRPPHSLNLRWRPGP